MIGRRGTAYLIRRCVALTLVASLVFVLPAYGAGSDSSSTIGAKTATPPPATLGGGPPAGAVKIGPGSGSGSSSTPKAPDPSVIGNPGVDAATQEFRAKLAKQQARLDAFTAELDQLDNELSIASEAYNDSSDKLAETNHQVATAELDLSSANDAYDRVSGILQDQVGTMYRQGNYSAVEILLDSKSLSDFLSRVKFLDTVGTDSAQVQEEYAKTQAELQDQVFKLRNAKRIAESLEFELKARKIEVQLRILERQQLFAATQSDLLTLLSQQAAQRDSQESALLKQILEGASKVGVTVTPGSPVETILAYHGVPYLWGGATPAGFDCSGLIMYVMAQHGVILPHYSGSQFLMGEKVAPADLQPGDVIFFGSPVHHVGMYIGGGYFVEAPHTGDYVKVSKLAGRSDYAGARRYPWQPRVGPIRTAVSTTSAALSSIN